MFSFAAKRLDFVTVADLGTRSQFRRSTSRVATIFNFPRLELFPSQLRTDTENCEFDLVYHGTNHRYYLSLLLDVDQQLMGLGKTVTWYVFGTFAELDWFKLELNHRNAESRFFIGGLVPHDQVFSEVLRAKIGIIPLPALPKYLNNIPQKLFEFMALGLPAVLSDLPPSRPFIEESTAGLMVDPKDPVAYAKAIVKLLDNPSICQAMGKRGRKLVEQKYNWDIESKKLILLVNALTGQQGETDLLPIMQDAD